MSNTFTWDWGNASFGSPTFTNCKFSSNPRSQPMPDKRTKAELRSEIRKQKAETIECYTEMQRLESQLSKAKNTQAELIKAVSSLTAQVRRIRQSIEAIAKSRYPQCDIQQQDFTYLNGQRIYEKVEYPELILALRCLHELTR